MGSNVHSNIIIVLFVRTLFVSCLFLPIASGFQTSITSRRMTAALSAGVDSTSDNHANGKGSWDPVAQIYTGGTVPGCDDAEIYATLDPFYVFGYGSLCWNPSGTLQTVVSRGRAPDHVRVWAQKSTDHRGRPGCPGIVCTLLTRQEYEGVTGEGIHQTVEDSKDGEGTTTASSLQGVTGLIYTVPKDRIQECLQELDFREKGGYAREIVPVVREDTGETVSCLLYRGTVDNPAFWPRAARDVSFAASIIAVASGPSGDNDVYLHQLAQFLRDTNNNAGDEVDDTLVLDDLVHEFREDRTIHFLASCGSNQYGQLAIPQRNGRYEDAHSWTEATVHLSHDQSSPMIIEDVYAGGGHSALRTKGGQLYLWGWNEQGQCPPNSSTTTQTGAMLVDPLPGIQVADAALGFAHTLVVEEGTRRLFAFGDNRMGQVTLKTTGKCMKEPTTLPLLADQKIQHCAAGVFHSAVVTSEGHIVVFGGICGTERFELPDGHFVKVACGARDLVLGLDNRGRLWSSGGSNKYGQCGRTVSRPAQFGLVEFDLNDSQCVDVQCGWSHVLALVQDQNDSSKVFLYGWGRNDLGQLGTGSTEHQPLPVRLTPESPSFARCGSESSIVSLPNGEVQCCGWNEHGNLGRGDGQEESRTLLLWTPTTHVGASPMLLPTNWDYQSEEKARSTRDRSCRLKIAAGGAHVLALQVDTSSGR